MTKKLSIKTRKELQPGREKTEEFPFFGLRSMNKAFPSGILREGAAAHAGPIHHRGPGPPQAASERRAIGEARPPIAR